ncbi:hypothetical protein ABLT32_13725 [Bacteroides pyogenes]|uniref:hypothetical protein n=1 Tax=Bacteroides pyogenes TaxID=310300 RepID=UPI0040632D5D
MLVLVTPESSASFISTPFYKELARFPHCGCKFHLVIAFIYHLDIINVRDALERHTGDESGVLVAPYPRFPTPFEQFIRRLLVVISVAWTDGELWQPVLLRCGVQYVSAQRALHQPHVKPVIEYLFCYSHS